MSRSRVTRTAGAVALVVILASCLAQEPPERAPLPAIEDVVATPRPCSFAFGESQGVRVEQILAGSASAGILEADDRIVLLDGAAVTTTSDVRDALARKAPGESVIVEVERDGLRRADTIVLGADPADPAIPRLGITISQIFDEVPVVDVGSDAVVESVFARTVQIGDLLFRVDPLTPSAARLEVPVPNATYWHVIDRVAYWVEDPSGDAALSNSDGETVEGWEAGANPARMLGTVGGHLVVVFLDDAGVSVRRIDPDGGEVVWLSRPSTDIGLPVVTYASPDESLLLLVLGEPESERLRFLLLRADTGAILSEVSPLAGWSTFGWFDDERLVVQEQGAPLQLFSVVTEEMEQIELAVTSGDSVRLWPVGDGRHLMIDSGAQLLRSTLDDPTDTRPLVARCSVGVIGQPGSGL